MYLSNFSVVHHGPYDILSLAASGWALCTAVLSSCSTILVLLVVCLLLSIVQIVGLVCLHAVSSIVCTSQWPSSGSRAGLLLAMQTKN